MNILVIKHFFVGFVVSEIPRVSVFGHCPYSVTFPYHTTQLQKHQPLRHQKKTQYKIVQMLL